MTIPKKQTLALKHSIQLEKLERKVETIRLILAEIILESRFPHAEREQVKRMLKDLERVR